MAGIKVRKICYTGDGAFWAGRSLRSLASGMAIALMAVTLSGLATAHAGTSSTSRHSSVSATARQGRNAQSANTQPQWANRGPAVAGDLQGYVHAAWENTAGQLAVALRDLNGNWTSHNLGIGPLGSQPTEVATPQVYQGQNWHYVFWQGRGDSALNMAYWGSNGQWTGPVKIPNTADQLNSQPAAAGPYTGGDLIDVYWTGNDNNIHYMYSGTPWDASSWKGPFKAVYGPNNTPIGPVVGAPAAAGTCTGQTGCNTTSPIYFTSDQNTVTRALYDPLTDTWSAPVTDNNISSLGSEPTAVSDVFAKASVISWRGSGGSADLYTMMDNYADFSSPLNSTSISPLDSAPAVGIIAPNGAVSTTWFFLWRGTNADLWDAREDSTGMHGPYDLGIGQICPSPQC
jgi:hypothetical protein